jgi:hypothetical protein
MTLLRHATVDDWKAANPRVDGIADHYRLPWRFHARIVATTGPQRA